MFTPIAVETYPNAFVPLPIAVEISPNAFVFSPIAVVPIPIAVVPLPIAIEFSEVTFGFAKSDLTFPTTIKPLLPGTSVPIIFAE